ncbi:MAG: hypothetical protein ACPHYF_03400 [Akkermansiaceae bacterium]
MSDPIYQDATMAQVRAVDGTFISYPFLEDGDTQTKVYNMVCTQTAADYNAAQVALDTPMSSAANAGVVALPFPADSAAYFVGDTGHTPVGGGMISFTRTFANIPQNVTVPSGSQFVTFPGIENAFLVVDALSMTFGTDGIYVTTSGAHGVGVGDKIQMRRVSYEKFDAGVSLGTDGFAFGDPDEGGNIIYSLDGVSTGWHNYTVLEVTSSTTLRIDPGMTWTQDVDLVPISGDVRNIDKVSANISSVSQNFGGLGIIITTTTAHNIDPGQTVDINLQYTEGNNSYVYSANNQYEVISTPNDTSFVVDVGRYWPSYVSLNAQPGGSVVGTGRERDQISFNVATETQYSYILPGVTSGVSSSVDINVPQSFRVVSRTTGKASDVVSNNDVLLVNALVQIVYGSTPSASDYLRMIDSGAHIVLESSLSEWAGNILVLKTKTCKAR